VKLQGFPFGFLLGFPFTLFHRGIVLGVGNPWAELGRFPFGPGLGAFYNLKAWEVATVIYGSPSLVRGVHPLCGCRPPGIWGWETSWATEI